MLKKAILIAALVLQVLAVSTAPAYAEDPEPTCIIACR